MARQFTPAVLGYDAAKVWLAAAVAQRLNGGYIKEERYNYETETTTWPNRAIVNRMMEGYQAIDATDEDRALAEAARQHFAMNLLVLLDDNANSYSRGVTTGANVETVNTKMELALIASAINSYLMEKARNARIEFKRALNSRHYGAIREAVQFANPEIIECRSVPNVAAYAVEAVAGGHLFTWWSQDLVELGVKTQLRGKVKAHKNDYHSGVPATQLNYVKLK